MYGALPWTWTGERCTGRTPVGGDKGFSERTSTDHRPKTSWLELTTCGVFALDLDGGKRCTGQTKVGVDQEFSERTSTGPRSEDLVTTGLSRIAGLALDVAGGKMYWMDQGANKIQRAKPRRLISRSPLLFPAHWTVHGDCTWTLWEARCTGGTGSRTKSCGPTSAVFRVEEVPLRRRRTMGSLVFVNPEGKMYWTERAWPNLSPGRILRGKPRRVPDRGASRFRVAHSGGGWAVDLPGLPEVNVNRPPVLDLIGKQSVRKGETLRIGLVARDPEGSEVAFEAYSDDPRGCDSESVRQTADDRPGSPGSRHRDGDRERCQGRFHHAGLHRESDGTRTREPGKDVLDRRGNRQDPGGRTSTAPRSRTSSPPDWMNRRATGSGRDWRQDVLDGQGNGQDPASEPRRLPGGRPRHYRIGSSKRPGSGCPRGQDVLDGLGPFPIDAGRPGRLPDRARRERGDVEYCTGPDQRTDIQNQYRRSSSHLPVKLRWLLLRSQNSRFRVVGLSPESGAGPCRGKSVLGRRRHDPDPAGKPRRLPGRRHYRLRVGQARNRSRPRFTGEASCTGRTEARKKSGGQTSTAHGPRTSSPH